MVSINKPAIHILAIIVFAILAYSNTLNVPFQLDDIGNIVSSPAIRNTDYFINLSSLEIPRYSDAFDKPLFKSRYIGYVTFALNYAVHGLDVRGYHIVNILIHICASLFLYRLVILTFGTPRLSQNNDDSSSRNFIAFFAALLFAVHPIETQAVTYIVQRFASLATMLWLLSLVSYVQFRLSSGLVSGIKCSSLYVLSLVSAVLAMKTKEFALLLPIVIVMYDFMFLEGTLVKRIQYLIPICLTVVIVPLSLVSATASNVAESASKISGTLGGISRLDYLFTQFRVIVTYIRLLFFPANQHFDYDYPVYRSFFIPEVAISFLFLLTIMVTGAYLFRLSRNPDKKYGYLYRLMSFGILWFFITISAESSIIPIADVIFEHRLYLPSIGFFITFVSAVELLRLQLTPAVRMMPVYSMLLLAAGLSVATYSRNSIWRDQVVMLEDEVKKSPDKLRPRNLLGNKYGELGRMDEAVNQFKELIARNPGYGGAHYSLGITYMRMGRLEEAIQEYKKTIEIKFDFADAHSNLSAIYGLLGRYDEAANELGIANMIRNSPK